MFTIEEKKQLIQKNLKGVRNETIRKRGLFLLRALQSNNISLTADKFGCSRQKFYFWMKRLEEADFDINALLDFSKAPKNNPNAIPEHIIELAIETRSDDGYGSQKVAYLLKRDRNITVNASSLGYIFQRRGISKVCKKPNKNKHNKRYSAKNPLDRVQADTKGTGIKDNNGNKVKFYPVIDDCSRVATVYVADEHSNYEATNAAQKFIVKFGIPEKWQTDNGVEYTYKYISEYNPKRKKESVISGYEQFLEENGIIHKLIRPRTPQLNGKVERFNQTLERELEHKIPNGLTISEIQTIVDEYVDRYNTYRPHSSLNYLTPYEKFYGVRLVKAAS